MSQPYVYVVGWTSFPKFYIGVRTANLVPAAQDLWVKYFTSSKLVKAFREQHGEPDCLETFLFDTKDAAVFKEAELIQVFLREYGPDVFLNRGPVVPVITEAMRKRMAEKLRGRPKSAEHRAKLSASKKGRRWTAERRAKTSAALKGKPKPWLQGKKRKPHSAETRAKISASNKGRIGYIGDANPSRRPEVRAKISAALKGREAPNKGKPAWNRGLKCPWASTPIEKRRYGADNPAAQMKGKSYEEMYGAERAAQLRKKVQQHGTCVHCGLTTNLSNLGRWHNDKCRTRST